MPGKPRITLEEVLKNPEILIGETSTGRRRLESESSQKMKGLNKVRGVLSAVHRVKQLIKLADKYKIDINDLKRDIDTKIVLLRSQAPADFMLDYVGADPEEGRVSPLLGSGKAVNKLAGLEKDLKEMESQINSKVFSTEGNPAGELPGISDDRKDEFLEALIKKLTGESADILSNLGSVQVKARELAGEMDFLDLGGQSDSEGQLETGGSLEVVVEGDNRKTQLLNQGHLEYVISQAKSRKILAEFIAAIDPARIAATARGESEFDPKKAAGCAVDGAASSTATWVILELLGAAVAGPATAAVAAAITCQQYWMISSQTGAEHFAEQIKVLGGDLDLAEPDGVWMTNLKRVVCYVAVAGRFADGWVAGQTLDVGNAFNATLCASKGLLGMVDSRISLHNEGDTLGMGSDGCSQMFEKKQTKIVHFLLGSKTTVLGVIALSEVPGLLSRAFGTNPSETLASKACGYGAGLLTMFGSVMIVNLFKRPALQDAVGIAQRDKTTINLISKLKEIKKKYGDLETGQYAINNAFSEAGIDLRDLGDLFSPTVGTSGDEGGAEEGCSLIGVLKKIDALGTDDGPEWARSESATKALAVLAAISNGGTFSVGISKVLLNRVFGVDMETASRVGLSLGFSGGACLTWSQIRKALGEKGAAVTGDEDSSLISDGTVPSDMLTPVPGGGDAYASDRETPYGLTSTGHGF